MFQATEQSTDLYTILVFYARKSNSPDVAIDEFIHFLGKYANRHVLQRPEWNKWTGNINAKVWAGIYDLVKTGKCRLIDEKKAARVLILDFYFEIVNEAYRDIEALAEVPFPNEEILGISIPPDLLRPLNLNTDMGDYLKDPQLTDMPLLSIIFPDFLDSALIPASFIPRRIMLISLLKISAFLNTGHNLKYFFTRLSGQFNKGEAPLKKALEQIETGPDECLNQIEISGDFFRRFWSLLCSQIRFELKKKTDFTALDVSTFQAAHIIEFFSNYYYKEAQRKKEKELTMKEIESRISLPPYRYTLHDIMAFTNKSGRPLKDFYDQKDLIDFLDKKTHIDEALKLGGSLPPLLVFHNGLGDRIYINKSKVLFVVTKLLIEARPRIQQAIVGYWKKRFKEFCQEPSMKDDEEFEKLVAYQMERLAPQLMIILNDKKLFLVQDELDPARGEMRGGGIYQADGTMRPLSFLLNLSRPILLSDMKTRLPFWYSIPFLFALAAFFARLGKGTENIPQKETPNPQPLTHAQKTKQAAADYQQKKLPPGKNIEQCLKELEDQWRKMISPEKKEQLVQDVRRQIKLELKAILETRKNMPITSENIDEMADGVIMVSPLFKELDNSEKIHKYVSLYITRLLAK
jgi:hypothetical protein